MTDPTPIRILLVEDDPDDADIFRRHMARLRRFSVTLLSASDPSQAQAALAADNLDLVFLDLNLNGPTNGLELLKALKTDPAAPPVVIVTGSGDEEKAAESMRSGAADYLVKDRLSPDLLERTVRSVRDKHLLERERDHMLHKLAELSTIDDLTAVPNRRFFLAKLQEELLRAERTGHTFALLSIDLDRFKEINDRLGHHVGDNVLRQCAAALAGSLRTTDFTARYGGDEFCVILPVTPLSGARRAAENLRQAVERLPDPVPTVSVGVALWEPRMSTDLLLSRADQALYAAKQAGRNLVVVFGD